MFTILFLGLITILIFILFLFIKRSALTTKVFSITVDGIKRNYRVHLPKNYTNRKRYPVLFVLHALGDNPVLVELNSGMSKKADEEQFITVYPKGMGKRLSWNAGFCCGYAMRNKVNDIKFIETTLNEIKENFSVDNKNIFMAGFSNGGMMTYYAASKISEIKAIAVISGTLGSKDNKKNSLKLKIPLLVMHGSKDNIIPFEGGGQYSFLSVEESINLWIGKNKIKSTKEADGYEKSDYREGKFLAATSYKVRNRGHIWFGGIQDYLMNRKIPRVNSTEIIWNFFKNI